MARNKEAIKQFDFIRAVACIGIVLYHFSVESGWFNIIRVISGGTEITWGDIYVTVFFAISGALLHYNNEGFKEFFEKKVPGNPLKAEYLIPSFIGELLEQGKMSVKVLRTNDTWYGMTYHEDVAAVKDSFKKMLENGVYKADLFSDL